MGLNVLPEYLYQYENKEHLRNAAKSILNKTGQTSEETQRIIEKTIFDGNKQLKDIYTNSQLSILKASTQISLNNTLKETLKYLKEHRNKKVEKSPVLGELWSILEANNKSSEKNPYHEELCDFKIDVEAKNIFAA